MNRLILIAALTAPLLAACTTPDDAGTAQTPAQAERPFTLTNTNWTITSLDGTVPERRGETPSMLEFFDDSMSAYVGCNRLTGSLSAGNGFIDIGALSSTRMGCSQPLMQQDRLASMLLQGAEDYAVASDGTLTINGSQGTITAVPAE